MTISIRIVNIDHYIHKPCSLDRAYSPFCNKSLSKVPVIRVFGSTNAGQKACLHIHQIYPYFFVPYTIPEGHTAEDIQKDIFQFGTCLNQALDLSKPNSDKNQHIAAIVLVKGTPFYGYHVGHQTFLKIYLTRPSEKQQIIDILQSQAIMGIHFQPFEAHLSFELQFMIDYNLYGMDWIHLDTDHVGSQFGLRFRLPLADAPKSNCPLSQSFTNEEFYDQSIYTVQTVPKHLQSDAIPRASHCELELDATGMCILNRSNLIEREIEGNDPHQDEGAKLIKSLEVIWKDEASRRRSKPILPFFHTPERPTTNTPWTSEASYRRLLSTLIQNQSTKPSKPCNPSLIDIMTAFQAVEALYPPEYHLFKSSATNASSPAIPTGYNTPPDQTSHGVSFNVSSSPSHYRTWKVQTEVDTSLIDSYVESKSALESKVYELRQSQKQQDEESDEFDEEEYSLRESDLVKWMEETERNEKSQHPIVSIEYEEEDKPVYKPRTLDFVAEMQKMDAILQKHGRQKRRSDFAFEDELIKSFEISDIPPDTMSRPNRFLKKYKIDQLDGTKDQYSGKRKDQPSSRTQWEQEKKILKRMKRKRKPHEDDDTIVSVVIKESPIFGRRKKKGKERKAGEEMAHYTTSPLSMSSSQEQNSIHQSTSSTADTDQEAANFNKEPMKFQIDQSDQIPQLLDFSSFGNILDNQKEQRTKLPMEQAISNSSLSIEQVTIPTSIDSDNVQPTNEHDSQKLKGDSSSSINNLFLNKLNTLWSPNEADRQTSLRDSIHEPSLLPQVYKESKESGLFSISSESKTIEENLNASDQVKYDWETYFRKIENATTSSSKKQTVSIEKVNLSEYVYNHPPPIIHKEDPILLNVDQVTYREPFYKNPADVPRYPTVFNGKEFRLKCDSIHSLKEFKNVYSERRKEEDGTAEGWKKTNIRQWTLAIPPPSFQEVQAWLHENKHKPKKHKAAYIGTQLDGPSIDGTFDFKYKNNKPVAKVTHVNDHVDYFSLEIHVNTRQDLLPDPEHDSVQVIFYCLQTDDRNISSNGYQQGYHIGIIALNDFDITKIGISTSRADIDYGETETELFFILIEKVRLYDPDMLVGYEVQNASWGYLIERATYLGKIDTPPSDFIRKDEWGYKKASTYKICGRHMLNVWRLMRSELTLMSYTFENVAYNLLHNRVQMNLCVLDASQVITRSCESARIFGIDFYSVITRGSQFKVESTMLRIAKPENFLMISPSRAQVAAQRSLECLPLVMEPISKFYSSPMAVLDFQSLYPSIMIAYNYCYSTCLGRVKKPEESSRFGVLESFDLPDGLLESLKDYINISPNGVMFVKHEIRKGLLGKMLQELLNTRVMVKKSMKDYKDDPGLLRMLDAKQLTLKFISNVTYGYTSASFSGRMPSVEIADSIVQTGRETLERTINLINETEKWGARVVYGDTDSVFVYFPGKSIEEAFKLGNEIADTVTNMNPKPIKLKFEKIYHPAVLLAKKRYVGFKYENFEDKEPVFEAKGIETVRRDHTPATQKILESSLKILFRTQDMSQLKEYLYNQWTKVLSNRVPLKDFIIAKEVRMGTYSSRGGPNGALVAQEKINRDIRAEPQYGERVPYVVIYKGPGAKLKDRVIRPEVVLNNNTLRLDAEYYIRKQIIAPISRIFNIIGVDIMSWYDNMPRTQKSAFLRLGNCTNEPNKKNIKCIDQYYSRSHCVVCSKLTDQVICEICAKEPHKAIYTLTSRQTLSQTLDAVTVEVNTDYADVPCTSLDCPLYYERLKAKEDVRTMSSYGDLINELAIS
ncbi:hypothetical protein G6F43_008737 [Rhizopus delemar]|nr:hypothetical protein G6F43_008737 [Rhizopus delemar]